jgi:hypothetical protein
MTKEQFTPKAGSEVYSLNGQKAEYVCAIPDEGHVVRPYYESIEDDAPFVGEAQTWSRVYSKPPTEVLQEEVRRLTFETAKLNAELSQMREERNGLERDYKARMAKLQRHKKLKRLEDFLDGKLTHYAKFPDYGSPSVSSFVEEKSDDSRYSNDTRLLSLFGRSNGDIEWKLNQYYDGSGSSRTTVIPCCSEEEAVEAVRARSKVVFAAWLNGKRGYQEDGCGASGFAAVADKFGFEVPQEYSAWERETNLKNAETALDKAKATQDAAQKAVDALKAVNAA